MNKAIAVNALHYGYNEREVISNVTFSVEAGEFVSILGPNGSGKTTLVRLLSGVMRPRGGTIEIFGRNLAGMGRREAARTVAVVPQGGTVAFPFTVEEIVLMGRFPHLGPYGFESERDMRVAREAMEATDTAVFASRHIQDLSGGERQRVIIARALAQEPKILLLDEPTTFLDIRHQVEISGLVKELQRGKGLTVVSVSHDLNLAALYSDRMVLLKAGRIAAEGRPGDVMRDAVLSDVFDVRVRVEAGRDGRLHAAPDVPA